MSQRWSRSQSQQEAGGRTWKNEEKELSALTIAASYLCPDSTSADVMLNGGCRPPAVKMTGSSKETGSFVSYQVPAGP